MTSRPRFRQTWPLVFRVPFTCHAGRPRAWPRTGRRRGCCRAGLPQHVGYVQGGRDRLPQLVSQQFVPWVKGEGVHLVLALSRPGSERCEGRQVERERLAATGPGPDDHAPGALFPQRPEDLGRRVHLESGQGPAVTCAAATSPWTGSSRAFRPVPEGLRPRGRCASGMCAARRATGSRRPESAWPPTSSPAGPSSLAAGIVAAAWS